MKIKQEHPEPVYYVDQPHYDEQQLYSDQMFAPAFGPSMGGDPDFSLEGRLIDPSKLGESGLSYEDNPNGYFPAFANEPASASAQHWSVDNIDSFLLTNSATGLERAQAFVQAQAREEARIREEMGDMTDDNMVHNTAYLNSYNVKIEDETDTDGYWDSKLAVDDVNGLPNGLPNDFSYGLADSIEQPPQTPPDSPTYIGKIDNDPDDYPAGPRFFMSDYTSEAEDADNEASEDDHADAYADADAENDGDDSFSVSTEEDFETRPLAEVFDQYHVKPSFSDHTRMLGLLHGVAEFMEDAGLSLESMMPCVEAFARELATKLARKEKELYETAIRANMGWS
ncbi:Hypothetical predicted protein [Lecanosticta acicola]|uniref:Uncharacterized protein n=1 Tax=Lecanosticta acicola TaxID=111012 RepID=A0AAI8Z445_9PEZI|nr:Hypothetical predicted protein [Lecanosticta acicola]